MFKKVGLLLVSGSLVFGLAACGEAEVGKVEKPDSANASEDTGKDKKDAPKEQTLKVGETVNFDGLEITLNEVRIQAPGDFDSSENGQYIVVNLTAENTTDKEQTVSSVMNIELKDTDGYAYNTAIYIDGLKGQFDGAIEPGGKLRGEIPFDAPKSDEYELHYSNPFKSGKAIWKIPADQLGQ